MEIFRLFLCIAICLGAGFISSIFTTPSIPSWYAGLNKPSFTPPNWIFGPVWTTLYALMGISLFLIWRKGFSDHRVKIAIVIFFVQLILNMLWSFMFFGLHSPFAGLMNIFLLWLAIVSTILLFIPLSKAAAVLLIPYILWVSFAAVLNYFLWHLNR